MTIRARVLRAHPATLVLASFLLTIAVGTVLLMLPLSTSKGSIPWVDAFFTATSAVCVTGLTAVDTGTTFTRFGQCVILALIQIGGLGVMTISVVLFRWVGRSISFKQRMVMQDLFAHTPGRTFLIWSGAPFSSRSARKSWEPFFLLSIGAKSSPSFAPFIQRSFIRFPPSATQGSPFSQTT